MKRYKGLGRVFSFTLTQQLRQRGWRTATIAVALACLLIPILSLTVAAQHQKNAAPEQNPVMEEGYTQEALDRAELTPEQRALLTAPVEVTVTGGQTGEGEAMGLLSMLLPFASLMLLYFLVLLYGQSTAASVILEKTSKLMDLFLVSVEPGAMVLGKVLATALAGLLQLAVWAAGLAGGFAIGGAVVRQTGVTLPLLEVLKGVGRLTGLFTPCWRRRDCCWRDSCCIAVCPPSAGPWPERPRTCPAPTCCSPWCWWPASSAACSLGAWTA